MFAVVNDADGDTVQLVDGFIIDQMVEVGGNFSTPTNHSGVFSLGYFVLSFRVACTENFFGSDCATLCVERDDELGHYTCDREGNIVCRERFQDLSTNCTRCREGYAGGNCTIGKSCFGLSVSECVIVICIHCFCQISTPVDIPLCVRMVQHATILDLISTSVCVQQGLR